MNWTEKLTMIKKNVGKKTDRKGKSKLSYTLYDSCNVCPLWVYVEIICNDNLDALIVSGTPTPEQLEEAKYNLIIEFSELSGNETTLSTIRSIRKIYQLKADILGLSTCYDLMLYGCFEELKSYLKDTGVNLDKYSEEKAIRRLESVLKLKHIQLKEELSRYEKLNTSEDAQKPTVQTYIEQLVALSDYSGYKVDMNISLAEYAARIKKIIKDDHSKK